MSKYGNKKTLAADGTLCDSKKEALRLYELLMMEKAGLIKDLKRQVKFVLIPTQRVDGKVVERECYYMADFVYLEKVAPGKWERVVEDTKGFRTKEYRIKRKLMLKEHGVIIKET